jgi:thiol-disulfide isomerase/thioredoxin
MEMAMNDEQAPTPPMGPPERPLKAKVIDYGMMAVVLAVLGYAAWTQMQPKPHDVLVGTPAPEFNLKTLNGEVAGLQKDSSKVVVLDFWATWCKPCKSQMPHLAEVEGDAEFADRVEVISINTDDPSPQRNALVKSFLERGGWSWDPLIDNGSVMGLYRVSAFPTIVVIDEAGNVHHIDSGVHSADSLRQLIREAGAS